jgi:hypothetical protein
MGVGISSSERKVSSTPDHDGTKPAANSTTTDKMSSSSSSSSSSSQPVQVFILLGQSNMVGMGKVKGDTDGTLEHAVKKEGLYPFLVEDEKTCSAEWATRKNTRYVRYMCGKLYKNEFMTVSEKTFGPELGIGHQVGDYYEAAADDDDDVDAPVMILKSCVGNRSLGYDLLPPGSESFEFEDKGANGNATTYIYAGYKGSPPKWEKGTEPKTDPWYAGIQWDNDIKDAKKVLADFETYYPEAGSFEIGGFFLWQGDKDRYDLGHATRYEHNLVQFIKALRHEFDAPDAKFVCATLGQSSKDGAKGIDKLILEAQLAVDGKTGKYPEFKDNVATVYTNPLSQGGASNAHYNGNAKTYMDVGLAMGEAMVKLLKDPPTTDGTNDMPSEAIDRPCSCLSRVFTSTQCNVLLHILTLGIVTRRSNGQVAPGSTN